MLLAPFRGGGNIMICLIDRAEALPYVIVPFDFPFFPPVRRRRSGRRAKPSGH